jgi:RNA polymerase sigma-70 factor (ECF subfamily)
MDEEAIDRMRNGDIGGLETLVRRYQEKAIAIAVLITRDSTLAQDVAQDAFLRAYDQIGHFDSARPFAPWLFKIVANLAIRRVQRTPPLSLDSDVDTALLLDPSADVEVWYEQAELQVHIRRALDSLPVEQRAAFVLRYLGGLKESEIAAELHCPPGTVKWRLSRARERLRAWLRPFKDGRQWEWSEENYHEED